MKRPKRKLFRATLIGVPAVVATSCICEASRHVRACSQVTDVTAQEAPDHDGRSWSGGVPSSRWVGTTL